MLSANYSELKVDEYRELRGNLFDLRRLHHLQMVNKISDFVLGKYYWVVSSPRGVILCCWKTKVKLLEIIKGENHKVFFMMECSIMDDNYVFTQTYDTEEYTFFEYE